MCAVIYEVANVWFICTLFALFIDTTRSAEFVCTVVGSNAARTVIIHCTLHYLIDWLSSLANIYYLIVDTYQVYIRCIPKNGCCSALLSSVEPFSLSLTRFSRLDLLEHANWYRQCCCCCRGSVQLFGKQSRACATLCLAIYLSTANCFTLLHSTGTRWWAESEM